MSYANTTGGPQIVAAARTDVGRRRTVNEDAALAEWPVYLVADGMGGHSAGDLASAAAIAAFEPLVALGRQRRLSIADVDAAIDAARTAVAEVAAGAEHGAGCTLTGVVLVRHEDQEFWYVINIGDSRVYQHRGASLAQITADHSLHAELLEAGHQDAASTPRNVITRALGSEDTRHDGWLLPVYNGMRLLICSDGLTGEVDDGELRAVLTVGGSVDSVAEELVRRACEHGGRDNVTVVIVDTVSGGVAERAGRHAAEAMFDADEPEETTLDVTKPVT